MDARMFSMDARALVGSWSKSKVPTLYDILVLRYGSGQVYNLHPFYYTPVCLIRERAKFGPPGAGMDIPML